MNTFDWKMFWKSNFDLMTFCLIIFDKSLWYLLFKNQDYYTVICPKYWLLVYYRNWVTSLLKSYRTINKKFSKSYYGFIADVWLGLHPTSALRVWDVHIPRVRVPHGLYGSTAKVRTLQCGNSAQCTLVYLSIHTFTIHQILK